jgi:hypothetical protein
MASIAVRQQHKTHERTALESAILGILFAMVLVWIPFQVTEIRSLFPPIGILYALGSVIVAGAVLMVRKPWSPLIASAWGALMMVPETGPAIGHLRDWSELAGHFGHYLVIMTFFPLALALVAFGIAATSRTYRGLDHQAPTWLRTAAIGIVSFIVIADVVVIALRVLDLT